MGQKYPLSLKQIWSIRHCLKTENRHRDLTLFDLAIDSKLRACDLLSLRVSDISSDSRIKRRATILQQKTRSPVKFEITSRTRKSIERWIDEADLSSADFLFRSHQQPPSMLQILAPERLVSGSSGQLPLRITRQFSQKFPARRRFRCRDTGQYSPVWSDPKGSAQPLSSLSVGISALPLSAS